MSVKFLAEFPAGLCGDDSWWFQLIASLPLEKKLGGDPYLAI